ncbi:MAG: GtrA family protein [Bacteroidales bacterium]|jgi:putative flippase GtrA|nr:GtrA family protein [Bacteroidales bacterium]
MDLKNKIPTIVKYFFVGGTAAFADLLIFYIFCKLMGFNYLLITAIGFIIATFINYILSIKFVFVSGEKFKQKLEILMIYGISSIALLVHMGILTLCIEILSIEKMTSKILAIMGAFMFNYLLRKYFVFKNVVK